MLKKLFEKGLTKDVGNILEIFKDNKGRFSAKRTVAGVIATAGVTVLTTSESLGSGEVALVITCFVISGLIVVFAPVTEAKTKDEYPSGGGSGDLLEDELKDGIKHE